MPLNAGETGALGKNAQAPLTGVFGGPLRGQASSQRPVPPWARRQLTPPGQRFIVTIITFLDLKCFSSRGPLSPGRGSEPRPSPYSWRQGCYAYRTDEEDSYRLVHAAWG